MAITLLGSNGLVASGIEKVSDNSWVITFTAATQIDDILILGIGVDNLSGTTPTISTNVDSKGNSWSPVSALTAPTASAAASVRFITQTCQVTVPHAVGDTLTITLSGAVTAKSGIVVGVRGAALGLTTTTTGTGTTANPAVTTGTSSAAGTVVIGMAAFENNSLPTGDSDTTNGSWSTLVGTNTTGGSAMTNVGVCAQMKVVTAAGNQTWNLTQVATDWAAAIFRLAPTGETDTLAYRFRNDDGSETAATWMDAANTPVFLPVNTPVRLRFVVAETAGIAKTDSWRLQSRHNLGTWDTNIAAIAASSNFANNDATTQQLSSGTFVAGRMVDVAGTTSPIALTASAKTEVEFCFTLESIYLSDDDVVDFRLVNAAGQPTNAATNMPSATVGSPPPPGSASLVKYWDGSAWTAKPLKRWDGGAWVDATLKRWDGSAWQTE